MKKYESYKSLSELWLSSIPTHWNTRKMKYLFSERSEKGYPDEPLLVASQKMGVVPKYIYGNRTVEAMKDLHLLKLVKVGDFVISLRSFQGGIEYAYYQGIISPAYTIMIPKDMIAPHYFKYLAKSRLFIELLQLCVTGIREGQNIDYNKLKNHQIPVPPHDEQDQIVRYLDWQVSKINKLIAAKKKQIALLNEQKQVIISNAVTKGLDHSVSMKDSGVLWIGKIPKHWTLIRNKNIFKERKETVGSKAENFTLLSLTTRGIIVRDTSESKGKFPSDFNTYKIVEEGNIVFCLFDIDETPRTVGLSSLNGMITGAYDVFQIEGIDKEYIAYYYISIDDKKALKPLYTGLRKVINPSTFLRIYSPIPPVEEQKEIVLYLNEQCEKIVTLINKINEEIALLTEYRARLISDVVTGQIDVRDIVIPEYEYVEEESNDEPDDTLIEDNEGMELS